MLSQKRGSTGGAMSRKNADNMTVADLQRNTRLIYAFSFCQAFMLIVPVLVPLFQSKGLSLSEIFYLQAIYAAVIVLFEAPSGYMADRFGRRIVLVVGGIANAVACFWLNFSDCFAGLVLFEAAMGLAMRSEEHTSELQSRENLVCRLLLEKKKIREDKQRSDKT